MFRSRNRKCQLSESRRYGLALSGVLAAQNHCHHDVLIPSNETAQTCKRTLYRDWSINDAKDLQSKLEWLANGDGQNRQFMEMLSFLIALEADTRRAFIEANRNDAERYAQLFIVNRSLFRLQYAGIMAWDSGRYIMLCRWGVLSDFLSVEQAWRLIMAQARRVQPYFTDWYDYGISYATGRQFWMGNLSAHHITYLMDNIKELFIDDSAPWRLPWHVDLTKE